MDKITEIICSYQVPLNGEYLYRYVVQTYHYEGDQQEDTIWLNAYPVVRKTRCKDVIDDFGNGRYVLRDARKRFAYPTRELAWVSLKKRMMWRLSYLGTQYDDTKRVYEFIKDKDAFAIDHVWSTQHG